MSDLPTTPDQLLSRLDALGVDYVLYNHEPIFTVEQGEHLKLDMPGTHCRNLFIRDKKEKMFLITAANDTQVDMKKLPDLLGCQRLSFGSPDRLWKYLGIRPGSVNPFCIVNDKDKQVTLIIDETMMKAEIINVHPFDNAKTIGLSPAGLVKYIEDAGHAWQVMDLAPAAPDA